MSKDDVIELCKTCKYWLKKIDAENIGCYLEMVYVLQIHLFLGEKSRARFFSKLISVL